MSDREPIKDDGSTIDDSRSELERQRDDIEPDVVVANRIKRLI